jgi:hypothetical protein
MRGRDENDVGQATMLLLAVVVLVALSAVAVAEFGYRIEQREQAQVAADAAALAGTTGGSASAAALAAANGGVLALFRIDGADVVVEVVVGEQRAAARATRAP